MIGLKKRDMKYIMKVGAEAQGFSVSEFRAMLQDTIDETMESTDADVQENLNDTLEISDQP